MGASTFIVGERPISGKTQQMLDLKKQCDDAGCDYPPQLQEFFEGTDVLHYAEHERAVQNAGEVDIETEGQGVEYGDGVRIDLSKIPEGVTHIRVYMS